MKFEKDGYRRITHGRNPVIVDTKTERQKNLYCKRHVIDTEAE